VVGLGLSFLKSGWIWIAKYDSLLISGVFGAKRLFLTSMSCAKVFRSKFCKASFEAKVV